MTEHNYYNTFIEVAEDCPVTTGVIPQPVRGRRTIAMLHYDLLKNAYALTQADVLYQTEALTKGYAPHQEPERRADFFSVPRACLRSSPLPKQYGWGIHFDAQGYGALVAVDAPEYQQLKNDPALQHVKALRTSRK